ncbi:U3 small nucleolar RNA-associated protein-like protein [Zopfia rhizophila CBS 207.26]|uniref:U3 small nucleolar RNA-associated protein-like protein n=1 Tax=Zopfia rhizophila CBS 207.26 TaxID=1314779 RepID=A0A6A6EVF6_9PEZI|nr:U3 small nucleolar RNA-associated protein-like protein [Zopfia rhizophila CBS 207.26]
MPGDAGPLPPSQVDRLFGTAVVGPLPCDFFPSAKISNLQFTPHATPPSTMPPKQIRQKLNHRKRFLPPKPNEPSESESEPSDAEPATEQKEPEWVGFGEEDGSNDNDDASVDFRMDVNDAIEKDESEEKLERLVFGDSAGFKEGIKSFSLAGTAGTIEDKSDKEQDEEEDLGNVADQDLFFFDSGPVAAPPTALAVAKVVEEEDEKPAWEDSDDDRLVISLASVPRLRKLRETEEDDVVSGKEYVQRLRKQYQRLYPTPEWALQARGKAKRKRRKSAVDGDSEEESASDMDVDGMDDLSTQPLAKLLRDADLLSRASSGPVKRRKLRAGAIDIQRLKDVAGKGPSAITSLSFHPTYPLLLSSGPSSTLSVHHINPNTPKPNPLLTSLHVKRTPLTTTAFHPSPSDSRIFLSARRRYFHIWNLTTGSIEKVTRVYGHRHEQRTMEYFSLSPNGKYMALRGSSKKGGGIINILDATTLQWVTQVRIESRGGVADFAWWGDGNGLSIVGKNGEVTEWSIKEENVLARWNDEGAVGTTTIALGGLSGRPNWIGGDRWVAVGSSSGIVNIYDRRAWSENAPSPSSGTAEDTNLGIPRSPKPTRALDHLTTPTSHLTFSGDGQILAMASRWKHNALRLVHLPSCTVFKNWPTDKTPLGRISAVTFGRPTDDEVKEGSLALLGIGSESGRIRLWEVRS